MNQVLFLECSIICGLSSVVINSSCSGFLLVWVPGIRVLLVRVLGSSFTGSGSIGSEYYGSGSNGASSNCLGSNGSDSNDSGSNGSGSNDSGSNGLGSNGLGSRVAQVLNSWCLSRNLSKKIVFWSK